jgi:AcrR family transcriptional regulator
MSTTPHRTSRRQQKYEDTIEEILVIARKMMQTDGVGALSFNAIARQLGMRPPSLYTYFDSKNAIYDELFRRGFEEFDRCMSSRPEIGGAFAANMRSAMESYMRFAQENQDLYQIMFQRPIPDFVPSERSMAVSWAALQKGENQFRDAIEQGALKTDLPPGEVQDLFIATMHGMTELHLANNPDLPVGEGRFGRLIPQAVQMFMDAWIVSTNEVDKEIT